MHIAFLTSEYPHKSTTRSAGIGSSTKNLCLSLKKKNIDVSVFVYSQDKDEVFVDNGIKIHLIKKKRFKLFTWYFYRRYINAYINKVIEKERISMIEIPDWTGISAFMKFNCKTVIKIHGSDAYFCDLEGRKQKWKNYFFERNALNSSDAIVSVSEFAGKKTKEIFKLPMNIKVLHNGIDTDLFYPTEEKSKNYLLYFGTVIRKKGVLELASIFNSLAEINSDIELILAGVDAIDNVENKSTIELFFDRLNKKYTSRVSYLGEVSYKEIKDIISKSRAVILPSFAEAFPMTWLETMSSKKVLFASNIGWASEIIDNEKNGFILNPVKHKEFAIKISEVISDEDLMSRIGDNARDKIVTNFSLEKTANAHIDFYKSLLHAKA